MRIEPLSNKPKISNADVYRGYVTRYFVQQVSTKKITEVDQRQFESIRGNTLYNVLELKWVIIGYSDNIKATDGSIIYGARHQNLITIEWHSVQMPGLNRILRNPLEYFVGRYAKTENVFSKIIPPRVTPPTSIDAPPSTPTTTTTTVSPESLPLYSLSLTAEFGRFAQIVEGVYILQANQPVPLSFHIVDALEAVGYSDEVCGILSGETVTANEIELSAGQSLNIISGIVIYDEEFEISGGVFTFDTSRYKITNTSGAVDVTNPLTIQIGNGTPTPRPPNVMWVEAGYRWTINYSFNCQSLPSVN